MLVDELHAGREPAHDRRVGALDDDPSARHVPGVVVEKAAEHLRILGPARGRDRCRVNADEAFAVLADEVEQVALLGLRHARLAVRVEQHGVEVVEVVHSRAARTVRGVFAGAPNLALRHEIGVGAQDRDIRAALAAELLDRRDRVARREMRDLIARGEVGDDEQPLAPGIGIGRSAPRQRERDERIGCHGAIEKAAAGRGHGHILATVRASVADGCGVRRGFQSMRPQQATAPRVERAKAVVVRCADEDQATCRDDRPADVGTPRFLLVDRQVVGNTQRRLPPHEAGRRIDGMQLTPRRLLTRQSCGLLA